MHRLRVLAAAVPADKRNTGLPLLPGYRAAARRAGKGMLCKKDLLRGKEEKQMKKLVENLGTCLAGMWGLLVSAAWLVAFTCLSAAAPVCGWALAKWAWGLL